MYHKEKYIDKITGRELTFTEVLGKGHLPKEDRYQSLSTLKLKRKCRDALNKTERYAVIKRVAQALGIEGY